MKRIIIHSDIHDLIIAGSAVPQRTIGFVLDDTDSTQFIKRLKEYLYQIGPFYGLKTGASVSEAISLTNDLNGILGTIQGFIDEVVEQGGSPYVDNLTYTASNVSITLITDSA